MKKIIFVAVLVIFVPLVIYAQKDPIITEEVVYKKIVSTSLTMQVLYPPSVNKFKTYPAMVFFFGGAWVEGTIGHFERQARYFARRGAVCFLVDYRVKSRHGTTPFESLMDAKSAIRFIRSKAEQFNIDENRIIAAGGSVGGQLAAGAGLIKGYNDRTDNLKISSSPNALVLYNPVIDNGPGNGTFEVIGDQYKDFSPLHNLQVGAPPTIIFQGTADQWIPVEAIEYYKLVMDRIGSRCDLKLYDGQRHGFVNHDDKYFKETLIEADKFLVSLGYLPNESVEISLE